MHATTFNNEANELAKAANGGDITTIKTRIGKLFEARKGCHKKFAVKDWVYNSAAATVADFIGEF